MTYHIRLRGEKCGLCPRTEKDIERFKQWDNDLPVILPASTRGYATPVTRFYQSDANKADLEHMFMIVDLETDTAIGWCALLNVDHINRGGELAIMIGEKNYWGNGFGQEATRLLLDYGFNILNLNRVALSVFAYNERAIHCYRKVGFKDAGRLRQARIIGGQKHDVCVMDMLAEEFESPCIKDILNTASSAVFDVGGNESRYPNPDAA